MICGRMRRFKPAYMTRLVTRVHSRRTKYKLHKLQFIPYTLVPVKKTHRTIFRECDEAITLLISCDIVHKVNAGTRAVEVGWVYY